MNKSGHISLRSQSEDTTILWQISVETSLPLEPEEPEPEPQPGDEPLFRLYTKFGKYKYYVTTTDTSWNITHEVNDAAIMTLKQSPSNTPYLKITNSNNSRNIIVKRDSTWYIDLDFESNIGLFSNDEVSLSNALTTKNLYLFDQYLLDMQLGISAENDTILGTIENPSSSALRHNFFIENTFIFQPEPEPEPQPEPELEMPEPEPQPEGPMRIFTFMIQNTKHK